MDRRTLLKLAALGGLGTGLPWLSGQSQAQSSGYDGPFWIFVTASGGWDPQFLFDPTLVPEHNRYYSEIGQVGNIPFAPVALTAEDFGIDLSPPAPEPEPEPEPEPMGDAGAVAGDAGAPPAPEPEPEPEPVNEPDPYPGITHEDFLNRHGHRLTVFNGIDMETNSHDTGRRSIMTGLNPDTSPSIGALLAATHGSEMPMPFMSFGGYDGTFNLTPLTRLNGAGVVRNIAFPNQMDPRNEETLEYHTGETYSRIRAAQDARLQELVMAQRLPKLIGAKEALAHARSNDDSLQALQLPELIDVPYNAFRGTESFVQAGQLALAGFKAGLTVSANLQMGGFDTHANHDSSQTEALTRLITGLSLLLDEIENQGLTDKVYVVVGSDFGRGPHYNGEGNNDGKDHWSIGSMMVMGPGIPGNRVIGATDDAQLPRLVDPNTLEVSDSGVKLTPTLIHQALRVQAGVDPALLARFPLPGETLPLFG